MSLYVNYTELQAKVLDWLDRDTYTTEVVDWIALAELRLNRELRIRQMLERGNQSLDAHLDVESDFTNYLAIESIEGLRQVDDQEFDDIWANVDAGIPKVFNPREDKILIAPLASPLITRNVSYYQEVAQLDGGNPTNTFTANADSLLLYATLLEAVPYLKDDVRIPTWEAIYDRTLQGLNAKPK